MTRRRLTCSTLLLAMTLAGCARPQQPTGPMDSPVTGPRPPSAQTPPAAVVETPSSAVSPAPPSPAMADVRYRVENRARDAADGTAGFAATVAAVLTDSRGWARAGFRFIPDDGGQYLVVLAEGDEVDRLCLPLDTAGTYSCQNGPVVALNADRWRSATPQWPADLDSYRTMLVNHEVGHLLHLHHPRPQCPGAGLPAPVMAQQSTSLGECAPNPWPLQWEIDLAARRAEPLAPPAEHDPSDHRPSPPPAIS